MAKPFGRVGHALVSWPPRLSARSETSSSPRRTAAAAASPEEPRPDVRGPQADRRRPPGSPARRDRRDREDAAADHVARY